MLYFKLYLRQVMESRLSFSIGASRRQHQRLMTVRSYKQREHKGQPVGAIITFLYLQTSTLKYVCQEYSTSKAQYFVLHWMSAYQL